MKGFAAELKMNLERKALWTHMLDFGSSMEADLLALIFLAFMAHHQTFTEHIIIIQVSQERPMCKLQVPKETRNVI